ncbi:hypothetical protein BDW68DRAFT_178605 [Aspergillus falconensis]
MTPEEIPVGGYTHLIFSFLYIDLGTYELAPMESNQTDLYARFTALKEYSIEAWISIGGWAMNDPGAYANVFSTLAASTTAQQAFLDSLVAFLDQYGFDGVDIDWEYPGASDRFGTKADYANFVSFLQKVRSALGSSYGLSITLPSSYWYLQNFDIAKIAETIDWFNFMSYDIYGTWDATIASIGSYVYASTNLTMIESGLQLLWHNNISSSQVNLGLGYYGRTFLHGLLTRTTLAIFPSISNATNLFPAGGSGKLTNGGVSTTTTTISVPEFEVTAVPFWPLTIASNQTSGFLSPVQSIAPPSLVLELPGSVTPFPQSTVNYTDVAESQVAGETIAPVATGTITSPATTTAGPTSTTSTVVTPSPIAANMASGCTGFYQVQSGDSCWSIETNNNIATSDFEAWNPDFGTGCANGVWLNYYYCIGHGDSSSTSSGSDSSGQSTSTGTTVVPVFYSTSHSVTIQPQATHTTVDPSSTIPPINVVIGPPSSSSSSSNGDCDGCGTLDCELFGCDGKCGLFGCDGGCDLWWCGGGCGLHYCGPGCGTGSCVVEGGGGGGGSTGSIGPGDTTNDDCSSMKTADICTVFVKSFSTSGMASSSTTSTTECAPTEGCSVTPSTTTTTISTTGTYSTLTNSFVYTSQSSEAQSVLESISASIVSQRSVWDATRWAGYTITITPTTTTTTTSTQHCSSTSTTTSASDSTTSTSTSTTVSHGTPTATSISATPTTFHSPSNKNHIEMNFYKDDSCGELIAGYEWDNDPLESSGYCAAWGLKEYDGGNMVTSSIYPVFSESDWNLGIMSLWGDCNANILGQQLKSSTCYKLDYNPDGDDSEARGSWIISSGDVAYGPGS